MKKCLIILLLGLLSFIPTASAQESSPGITTKKPIICAVADDVLTTLKDDYGEKPILMGKEPVMLPDGSVLQLRTMIWVNADRGTYTIIQQPPPGGPLDGLLCILTAGSIEGVDKKAIRTMLGDVQI